MSEFNRVKVSNLDTVNQSPSFRTKSNDFKQLQTTSSKVKQHQTKIQL